MGEFIEKYIFPGGELTHISNVLAKLTDGGLEGVDIENLRPHYARTLWAWSDALEDCLPEARSVLGGEKGERSLRAYRMYLARSEEHTSELQSIMRTSYSVFCLKKKQ